MIDYFDFTVENLISCLEELLTNVSVCENSLNYNFKKNTICNIFLDSRKVVNNSVFITIDCKDKSSEYLAQAKNNGAILAIVDKDSYNSNIDILQIIVNSTKEALGHICKFLANKWLKPRICITGSNGKTSTKFILESILLANFDNKPEQILCSIKSFNNNIGVPITMFNANKYHEVGIFEMGTNHPGEIAYLSNLIKTNVAVLLNIASTHIGNFNNLDDIAKEKFNIFNNLKDKGVAVFNFDFYSKYKEQYLNKLLEYKEKKNIKLLSFSLKNKLADVYASEINITSSGSSFKLNFLDKSLNINLNLLGKQQIENSLAAVAAYLGFIIVYNNKNSISLEKSYENNIKQGLENIKSIDRRMQPNIINNNLVIIDDSYNASPKSVNSALEFLSSLEGIKIFVLGDLGELGDNFEIEHKNIGKLAKNLKIDYFYSLGEGAKLANNEFYENNLNYQFTDKKELSNNIIELLKNNNILNNTKTTILIKASNFIKLWEVTDLLKEKLNVTVAS